MDARLSSLIAADTARLAAVHRIDWLSLHGADLLLTGCTGPFGWWLLHKLSHACAYEGLRLRRTTLVTRDARRTEAWASSLHHDLRLQVVQADIRRLDQLELRASHVVHGATTSAAETSAGASGLSKFETVVDGTRALIRALDANPPRRLLYLSSGIAYGASHAGLIREGSHLAPCTTDSSASMGHAKRTAEFLMSYAAANWGASLVIARCFAFSGPGLPLDLHYALGNFVAQAIAGKPIVIKGDGTAVRSYMHFGDMAIWLSKMLTYCCAPAMPRIFNVGSDLCFSVRELAELVIAGSATKCRIEVLGQGEVNASGNSIQAYTPCIDRARSELHLELWTTVEESILQMLMARE